MSSLVPNTFQVPNMVVDRVAGEISAKSFACLIFIIRKTRGWNKSKDSIPLTQLKTFLGTKDKRTVHKIVAELESHELISVHRETGKVNEFSLGNAFELCPEPGTKNVGTKNVPSSKKCTAPGTKNVPTTRYKKCTPSKDTTKPTIQKKENNTKEKLTQYPIQPVPDKPIDPQFEPTDQDIDLLRRKGIPEKFIQDQVPEFVAYWQEVGRVGKDWRAKFRNRVTRQWLEKPKHGKQTKEPSGDFSEMSTDAGFLSDTA